MCGFSSFVILLPTRPALATSSSLRLHSSQFFFSLLPFSVVAPLPTFVFLTAESKPKPKYRPENKKKRNKKKRSVNSRWLVVPNSLQTRIPVQVTRPSRAVNQSVRRRRALKSNERRSKTQGKKRKGKIVEKLRTTERGKRKGRIAFYYCSHFCHHWSCWDCCFYCRQYYLDYYYYYYFYL